MLLGTTVLFEDLDESEARQAPSHVGLFEHRLDANGTVQQGEVHLVAGSDPELVPQVLGDDDLALGPNSVSHTSEYNSPPCPPTCYK